MYDRIVYRDSGDQLMSDLTDYALERGAEVTLDRLVTTYWERKGNLYTPSDQGTFRVVTAEVVGATSALQPGSILNRFADQVGEDTFWHLTTAQANGQLHPIPGTTSADGYAHFDAEEGWRAIRLREGASRLSNDPSVWESTSLTQEQHDIIERFLRDTDLSHGMLRLFPGMKEVWEQFKAYTNNQLTNPQQSMDAQKAFQLLAEPASSPARPNFIHQAHFMLAGMRERFARKELETLAIQIHKGEGVFSEAKLPDFGPLAGD